MSTAARFILTSALALFAMPVDAVQLSPEGCQSLAQFVGNAAQMRDLGANEAKHLAAVQKANADESIELREFLKQLIEGVYASKASPEELAAATMEMCLRKEGKIGEGV